MSAASEKLDSWTLQYRALVAKMAIRSWWMYPPQVRWHHDVEDMIQDGLIFIRYKALREFNKKKQKGFPYKYLENCLQNFYINVTEYHSYKKRWEGNSVQIEDMVLQGKEPVEEMDFCSGLHTHVVSGFVEIYYDASDSLRESIMRWFLRQRTGSDVKVRVRRSSIRFQADRREFLTLAKRYHIDKFDCEVLMGSSRCQLDVIERLPENCYVSIPVDYDVELPFVAMR